MPPQSKGVRLQFQNRCTFAAQSKRCTRQPRKSMHLCGFRAKGVSRRTEIRYTFVVSGKRCTPASGNQVHLLRFGQKVHPGERKSGTPFAFRAEGASRRAEIRYTFWHDSPQARRHAEPRHQRARPANAVPSRSNPLCQARFCLARLFFVSP